MKEADVRKVMYLLSFNYIRCKNGYNIILLNSQLHFSISTAFACREFM